MPVGEEVQYLVDLEKVIKAYEEIAAFRMQEIRQKVLENREFTLQLNHFFNIIKNSYKKEVAKRRILRMREKNGKTARVFVSANTGLYGDIVQRTFSLFLKEIKQSASDLVIIGRLGKVLLEAAKIPLKYTYFEIPDTKVVLEEVKKVAEFLMPYETVMIYHGLFKNILMQNPTATNITGDISLLPEEKTPTRKLIFEPSLEEILSFFETEIFSSLLIQAVYEAQLAKFSSRMSTLEQASENIRKETLLKMMEENRKKKRNLDKNQLNTLSGMQLWGT